MLYDPTLILLGINADGSGTAPAGSTGYIDFAACTSSQAAGALTGSANWGSGSFNLSAYFQEGIGIVVNASDISPVLSGSLITQMQSGGVVVFEALMQSPGHIDFDFHDADYNIEYTGFIGYDPNPSGPHDTGGWVKDGGVSGYGDSLAAGLPGLNRAAFKLISGTLAVSNNGGPIAAITGRTAWAPHPLTEFGIHLTFCTLLKLTTYPSTVDMRALSSL